MMIEFLRHRGHPCHEGEGLLEILEDEFPANTVRGLNLTAGPARAGLPLGEGFQGGAERFGIEQLPCHGTGGGIYPVIIR